MKPNDIKKYKKDVEKLISQNVKKKLATQTVRKELLLKHGKDAFLDPDALKYPIVDPYTGKTDCNLIALAYLNAIEKNDDQIKLLAISKFKNNNCKNNLKLNFETSNELQSKPEDTNLDLYAQNRGQLRKNEDQCICPTCQFECALSLDIPACKDQTCPICGDKMEFLEAAKTDVTDVANENFSELIREAFDGIQETPEGKFICDNCRTVVPYEIKTILENECPKCHSNMRLLRENIKEKRNYCPHCNSSYLYESANKNTTCYYCNKYTYISEQLEYNKKKGKPIPFNSI